MRHRRKTHKLGRTKSHRQATLQNMANQMILHKQIRTTLAKAKAARGHLERLITHGKKDTVAARRLVFKFLQNHQLVKQLFDEIVPTYSDRNGGYTRIIKLGKRKGDGAEMAILQFVGFEPLIIDEKKDSGKKSKKKATTGKKKAPKKTKEPAAAPAETEAQEPVESEVTETVEESKEAEEKTETQPEEAPKKKTEAKSEKKEKAEGKQATKTEKKDQTAEVKTEKTEEDKKSAKSASSKTESPKKTNDEETDKSEKDENK